jgi:hypothetical protein
VRGGGSGWDRLRRFLRLSSRRRFLVVLLPSGKALGASLACAKHVLQVSCMKAWSQAVGSHLPVLIRSSGRPVLDGGGKSTTKSAKYENERAFVPTTARCTNADARGYSLNFCLFPFLVLASGIASATPTRTRCTCCAHEELSSFLRVAAVVKIRSERAS